MNIVFVFRKANPVYFSIERVFLNIAEGMEAMGIFPEKVFAPGKGISIANIISAVSRFGKKKAGIYHVTGDLHYVVLALPRRNTVLTIHDCVFLHQTKGVKRWVLKKLFLDWPVRYCKAITTISEATKKDILLHTGCKPEKITVIPNPIDAAIQFKEHVFREACPEILFVGVTPNKNLERVIKALEGLTCSLHIIGKIPAPSLELLKMHHISFRQSSNLTDEEMAGAYASADLVLFPSLFEGFGLPIVEAQKTGRAVITSDISPMKEVAGGAACLVDPYSTDSIRSGVLSVIGDRSYRQRLVEAGSRNAARYDVRNIAQQYLACYQKMLTGNPSLLIK